MIEDSAPFDRSDDEALGTTGDVASIFTDELSRKSSWILGRLLFERLMIRASLSA